MNYNDLEKIEIEVDRLPISSSTDYVNKLLATLKQPRRPIAHIIADLSKPIPEAFLDTLKDKGSCKYLPWFNCTKLLDRCTGGHWQYSIHSLSFSENRIFLVARIEIFAEEGNFFREATGTELLLREHKGELKEHAYGDPSSNAESMALRRAAAKFGLALYLYDS